MVTGGNRKLMATLRDTDRQALVKLLSDDDATVLQLLEEKFLEMGPDGLAFLETVARDAAPDARRGARRILLTISERDVLETFARFCATCGSAFDLEAGCWLLAKTRYPDLDTAAYQARLDQMARELKERLTGRETPRATIEVCNRYFFRRLGFRGNEEDYYDPLSTSHSLRLVLPGLSITYTQARVLPSGVKVKRTGSLMWKWTGSFDPSRVPRIFPLATSQILTFSSRDAVTRARPSGVKAVQKTTPACSSETAGSRRTSRPRRRGRFCGGCAATCRPSTSNATRRARSSSAGSSPCCRTLSLPTRSETASNSPESRPHCEHSPNVTGA